MPTSSQFLILQYKINGLPVYTRSSRCLFNETVKFPVASAYNIGRNQTLSVSSVADRDAVKSLGKEGAYLFKHHRLPSGYISNISLDRLSNVALVGSRGPNSISSCESESTVQTRCRDGPPSSLSNKVRRSKSNSAEVRSTSKAYVDPLTFEYLIKLGFSRSGLAKRTDCVFDSISTRRVLDSNLHGAITASGTGLSKQRTQIDESKTKSAFNLKSGRTATDNGNLEDKDTEKSSENDDLVDGFHRVKPPMHMRSDIPQNRPRAAIFSFRDNAYASHAEVKYLIETQIGVKVKTIQFDPLDIRSAKPGVGSRWIVEFYSSSDLNEALKQGLTVGTDRLIFFKHDDIAKHEVSGYKYFKAVQEARRKLKSRSQSIQSAVWDKRSTHSQKR